MTTVTVKDGKVVIVGGLAGTGHACCCNVPCTCNTIDCGPLYVTVGDITATADDDSTLCSFSNEFTDANGVQYFESASRSFLVPEPTCFIRDGKVVLQAIVRVDSASQIIRRIGAPFFINERCYDLCGTKYTYELELCDENALQSPSCSTAFSFVGTSHGTFFGDSQKPCDTPPECLCEPNRTNLYVPTDDEGCPDDCWEDQTPSYVGFNPLP